MLKYVGNCVESSLDVMCTKEFGGDTYNVMTVSDYYSTFFLEGRFFSGHIYFLTDCLISFERKLTLTVHTRMYVINTIYCPIGSKSGRSEVLLRCSPIVKSSRVIP